MSVNVDSQSAGLTQAVLLCVTFALLMTAIPSMSLAQKQQRPHAGADPLPEPAVPSILAAFDKYDVVGMPEAHGLKDVDDFILSLIRNPAFAEKVNDIAVECGNSMYQSVLDRYIAGEDIPFTEVQKVWRNTTQMMCSSSAFFEQLFPLVRAINRKLPSGKRLRMLAADPPIDWGQVKSYEERWKFGRDASIASVMEQEVLARHRKALMLFGTFHLMHHSDLSAVSIYEKKYPNRTFVISDLGYFDTDLPTFSSSPFVVWPIPSLVGATSTWLGALGLDAFLPPQIVIDDNCHVRTEFPKGLQRPMEELVDAFLYLGPQDLLLKEKVPADIALDVDYRMELLRRESLPGVPKDAADRLKGVDREVVSEAGSPLFVVPKLPDTKSIEQICLDQKKRGNAP